MKRQSRFIMQNTSYHPDYTVGPGVSPGHALCMQFVFSKLQRKCFSCVTLVGFTTDREWHAAYFATHFTLPRSMFIQLSNGL
jgi:hypothetical protein